MVTVIVERNASHPKGEAQKVVGRFEWVQLTYSELRRDPDGEPIATLLENGYWELESDGSTWSDIIIGGESK